MVTIIKGDLLKSDLSVIGHQTNCLGVMGVVFPMLLELFADTDFRLFIYQLN